MPYHLGTAAPVPKAPSIRCMPWEAEQSLWHHVDSNATIATSQWALHNKRPVSGLCMTAISGLHMTSNQWTISGLHMTSNQCTALDKQSVGRIGKTLRRATSQSEDVTQPISGLCTTLRNKTASQCMTSRQWKAMVWMFVSTTEVGRGGPNSRQASGPN